MLLTESNPLVVIPELAREIGITEAIILQQIHYWVQLNKKKNSNFKDGQYWTYNTIHEWQEQFPWICDTTIKRTLIEMQKNGFIITGVYNKAKYDRTKWYRVNYENEVLQGFGCFCEAQETLSDDWWTDKEFFCSDTQ